MKLTELMNPAKSAESDDSYDPGRDMTIPRRGDTRKTRLTLRQINRLRKLNDAKTVDYHEAMKKVRNQYGTGDGDGGPR